MINRWVRIILLLTIILLPINLSFADNPFLSMINKPYAEYMMEMKLIHYELDYMEQSQADSLMKYMEEAAEKANNRAWKFESEIFRTAYRHRYNTRIDPNTDYTIADQLEDFKAIYNEAREENDTIVYLRVLRGLMNAYVLEKDYEQVFETTGILEKELEHISVSQLPEKLLSYREMAGLYYKFRDYPKAETFFRKIVECPEANTYSLLEPGYNGLGLIYRYHYQNYDKSDDYFRRILTVPEHENSSAAHCLAWKGIANGNLGTNLYRQKKYDEAIPLLEFSRETMIEVSDYTYATGMAALLANIYLEKRDLGECKRYMDMAVDYIHRSYPNQLWLRIYPVMAKYYTMTGHAEFATAYQDSATIYQRREHEEYDALKLMYANLRMNEQEQRAKDDELLARHLLVERYKCLAIYTTVGLLLVIGLLLYVIILYRKKRVAHRMLVKKSQGWAVAKKTSMKSEVSELPINAFESAMNDKKTERKEKIILSEAELALMQRIRQLMDEEKVYTDPNFTLTVMAERLDVNRTYVSATINRCMGKTLTHFMNEYRVMLAIDIMSLPENASLTIDAIAEASGFNDRKTFYRIFKKITGLAPSEFKANVAEVRV